MFEKLFVNFDILIMAEKIAENLLVTTAHILLI